EIEGIDYSKREIGESDKQIIINDVMRSFQFVGNVEKKKMLMEVLQLVLLNLPVMYVQGMSEIVSVIVYYYCGDKDELEWKSADISVIESISGELTESNGKEDKDKPIGGQNGDEEDTNKNMGGPNEKDEKKMRKKKRNQRKKGIKPETSENSKYNRQNGDEDLQFDPKDPLNRKFIEKLAVVSTNILKMKYLPLIDDDFKIYLKNNKIFLKMMKKRGKTIQYDLSIKYMNQTLTWFTRKCGNISDMFTLFSIFISCPTSFPFLVLTLFYEDIESGKNIKICDDLLVKLIDLEREFLEIQINEVESNSGMNILGIVFIGSVLVVGLAMAIAGYRKKEE
ncbi:hypothetical protein EQH57_0262, partial [Dictyocoela roeselum]